MSQLHRTSVTKEVLARTNLCNLCALIVKRGEGEREGEKGKLKNRLETKTEKDRWKDGNIERGGKEGRYRETEKEREREREREREI